MRAVLRVENLVVILLCFLRIEVADDTPKPFCVMEVIRIELGHIDIITDSSHLAEVLPYRCTLELLPAAHNRHVIDVSGQDELLSFLHASVEEANSAVSEVRDEHLD